MSEEHAWLGALGVDQLAQACRSAGVKVDGFRHLNLVPRLLLERQIWTVLTRQRGYARPVRLRSTLADAWRERYATLAELLKAGPTGQDDERPDDQALDGQALDGQAPDGPSSDGELSDAQQHQLERWGEWLTGLCQRFGRAPVEMGVRLGEVPAPTADPEFWLHLDPYWSAETAVGDPAAPQDGQEGTSPDEQEPLGSVERDGPTSLPEPASQGAEESAAESRQAWRQERAQLRAKVKSLTQEIQLLQRARTSAEARAAHYQALVEQVRSEMSGLAERREWPHPRMLVERLIRGLMEARRQILDLEIANAELRLAMGEAAGAQPETDDEAELEDVGAGN